MSGTPELSAPAPQRPAAGRRHWRAYLLVALLLVVAAVVWDGAVKTPSGPAQGESFHQVGPLPTTFAVAAFRVGTFNIDGGQGADGKRDLRRTAAAMRGCDLLGVQEVHGASLTEHRNQAQVLGEELKMAWLYAPTEQRWWHDDFGNAVLSHLPVNYWSRLPISTRQSASNRNAVLTRIAVDGRMINLLVTHVGRHEDHDPQMRAVVELFLSFDEPAILMGDLNATSDDPQIRRLRATAGVIDAIGPAVEGKFPHHVDWIFLRGLRGLRAGASDEGASDHPFFWADVEIEY